MIAHQAALDEMFRGLVVPSAASWREGALKLKTAPLHRGTLPNDPKLTRSILAIETRVHQEASRALKADNPSTRATIYADLITQCAGCHSLHRKVWGPASR